MISPEPIKSFNIPKWVIWALLVVSFIGFLDAAYLTVKHYFSSSVICSFLAGCEIVTTSQYATIGNIPIALLGTLFYLAVFILSAIYLDTGRSGIIKTILGFSVIGFLSSVWFVYLQLFILKAICFYCMISAVTSTFLFILSLVLLKYIIKSRTN